MYLMRATILCSQEREEVSGPGQVDPVADDRQVHQLAIRDAQEGIPAVACFHHSQPGAFFGAMTLASLPFSSFSWILSWWFY